MADLRCQLHGLTLPNPFIVASGPPSTNANVIAKAFDEGWGGVVAKTACLDAAKIINVAPRYARLRAGDPRRGEIMGWENIELISDRPLEVWLEEFKLLKKRYPDRVLIASVTEACEQRAWEEIITRCEKAGVDAFELNLSCPHGLPERKMGSAIGQSPELAAQVCGWVRAATKKPFWAKLTPNITDITQPGRAALHAGADGLSAINTILGIMGVDLQTLRPEPTVEGHSTAGGYSYKAVRPIALRMAAQCAQLIRDDFPSRSLLAIGGVASGGDAAQFILLGAHAVQVCTGVMIEGYSMARRLTQELEAFMGRHGFATLEDFRGHSLKYLTSHAQLVRLQAAQRAEDDGRWTGEEIARQSELLARG